MASSGRVDDEIALAFEASSFIRLSPLARERKTVARLDSKPRSRQILGRILDGVSEEERRKIMGANVARHYHFDLHERSGLPTPQPTNRCRIFTVSWGSAASTRTVCISIPAAA
jgi:hypothetical protein